MARSAVAREGLWFAVPLRDEGWGTGVVARANPKGVLFGYFFGPRRDQVPTLEDVGHLSPKDAVLITRFGWLGLKGRTWPQLGIDAGWDRSRWSIPPLIRYEELTGRSFRVIYDDNDPNRLVREERVEPGVDEQGPTDGLGGAGWVEIRLTKLLAE